MGGGRLQSNPRFACFLFALLHCPAQRSYQSIYTIYLYGMTCCVRVASFSHPLHLPLHLRASADADADACRCQTSLRTPRSTTTKSGTAGSTTSCSMTAARPGRASVSPRRNARCLSKPCQSIRRPARRTRCVRQWYAIRALLLTVHGSLLEDPRCEDADVLVENAHGIRGHAAPPG